MKKVLNRVALVALLFTGSAYANADLLSIATNGATSANTSSVKVLDNSEMENVVGGILQNYQKTITRTYVQNSADIKEGYMGYSAKIYYRKMNSGGSESWWINYFKNGSALNAYGTQATNLINTYKYDIQKR